MESPASQMSEDSACGSDVDMRQVEVVRRPASLPPDTPPAPEKATTQPPQQSKAAQAYMRFTQAIMAELQALPNGKRRAVMQLIRDRRNEPNTYVPEYGCTVGQLALYIIPGQRVRQRN